MSDLDREFAKRLSAQIADLTQIAILKSDTDALRDLDRFQARADALAARMPESKVIDFR